MKGKLALIAAVAVMGLSFATPAFAYGPNAATVSSSTSSTGPGGSLTVSGSHFVPGGSITIVLHSTPVTLATTTADPTGSFSVSVTIPSDTVPGAHEIIASDTSGDSASTDLTVTGTVPTATASPTSRTGSCSACVTMRCATCHQGGNFDPAGMPGHPHWHLAPREMAWQDKTLGEICTQIKDPARNGGRSLAQILTHIATDSLVGWAWAPGAGREPAPGTQKELGALIEAWVKTGAVCPR